MSPPATFPRAEGKIKPISLPEDVYIKKFNQKHPNSMYHDAISNLLSVLVRKLQYIAELERNVQALQVEGVEVFAELEFLNQQHLILSMENKALKQRLESLAQGKLIKYVEHDILEREPGRLRALYQQQQPPLPLQSQKQQAPGHQRRGSKDFNLQHQMSGHQRKGSRDLDLQLANLSLKQQKDTSYARDHVPCQLNI